jgi:hypothetical protein
MLRLSFWFVAIGAAMGIDVRSAEGRTDADALAVRLAKIPNPAASGRAIGQAYLQTHPRAISVDELIAQLGNRNSLEQMDDGTLRAAIRTRHRHDLHTDNLVEVRGWVLSRAEASLYALTELVEYDRA